MDHYYNMFDTLATEDVLDHRPRTLNLTQLRRNKRKLADKTSGRKQLRFRNVNVEGADDADDDVASQLVARSPVGLPPTLSLSTLISPYVTPAIGKNPLPRRTSASTPIPSPGWCATSAHGGTTVCVWDE